MNPETKPQPTEQPEPGVSFAPVPVILFVILGFAFYWGTLYLDKHAGGFSSRVYLPYDSERHLASLQPAAPGNELFAQGKKIYEAACLPCHQGTGLGAPGVAPPLAGSEWVLTPGPGRPLRIAYNGIQGPITVLGTQWNLAMPAMGQQLGLSDTDLAALLTYIRTNKDWGNNASPVTPEQVQAARAALDARTTPWTSAELLQIPETE